MNKSIEVNNITKTFKLSRKQMKIDNTSDNKKVAVSNLSFCAYPGEIFGLLGPNGAGKTTTMRIIATLIKADSGQVLIDGEDVNNDISIKRKMAFLTGELKLEQNFTPNYIYDFFSGLYNISADVKNERKKELFDRFGIDKFAEVKIGDLSQGMKQKLSIVISLVHNPSIIVFDEPTNGLDVVTARAVTEYLKELKNKGKTILISTHIMSLAQKLCDRIGVIYDGKMLLCDTTEALLQQSQSLDLEDMFFNLLTNYNKESASNE
ncbi:MAG: ABC transporter ATP-binding protein [Clostridia bacterium]